MPDYSLLRTVVRNPSVGLSVDPCGLWHRRYEALSRISGGYRRELPQGDALIRRQIHSVAFLDPESFVESWLVAQRRQAAHLLRRMRIDLDQADRLRYARFAAPDLRPAVVKTLFAGQPVDDLRRFAAKREFIGAVGDCEARVVGDVFAQGQRAVDVEARR